MSTHSYSRLWTHLIWEHWIANRCLINERLRELQRSSKSTRSGKDRHLLLNLALRG
jgi:hypothetical protein